MIIAKNPQLKTEANNIKSMMLKHAYTEEKKVNLRSFHWNDTREVTANVCVYKTDKGEYMHPVDMNNELTRRFELLERFSSISNGETKASDQRALDLQEMYTRFKSMPIAQVKSHVRYIKRNNPQLAEKNHQGRYIVTGFELQRDELYVIENLLNIR